MMTATSAFVAPVSARTPLWRRLDVRLALVVLAGLGAVAIALLSWQAQQAQRGQDAFMQWQSLNLAHYIAQRQPEPMIDAKGRANPEALAATAMYIGMIHPALEAYLLDREGRVLQHSVAGPGPLQAQVDLRRVAALLAATAPALPVYGDDPRAPGRPNLVSIAALPSPTNPQGYLYVVLRGEEARLVQRQASGNVQRDAAWGVTVALLLAAALVIVAAQMHLTRRLRRLATELQQFRQPDDEQLLVIGLAGDEIDQVADAAQTLQQRVQQQFQRLEDGDRLRRELVSNISHDLHTPLANIQGYVETLLLRGEQLTPSERAQYLHTTLNHCRSLGRRVAELFELSKLESGQTQARLEPFCMAELLNDVVHSHQLAAQKREVTLRLAQDTHRTVQVLADIGLIERVLQNLVDNALRHTPQGGLVELAVRVEGARVQVRVTDTGQGIAEADLPRIFDRYWTTRAATDQVAQPSASAGLGLAIVRRILELHGSTIGVRSAVQQGTEFSFALAAVA